MNGHLSEDRFSAWVVGERDAETERHLRDCPACRAELAALQGTLSHFRTSLKEWSAREERHVTWNSRTVHGNKPLRWVLALATLFLLIAVPAWRSSIERRHAVERAAMDMMLLKQDAVLLRQVDMQISRAVPETMEPLVKLVSWDSGPADGKYNERQ